MASISLPAAPGALWRDLSRTGLKWLYIVHRWIGIVTCLLCAVWFISGLVMVYVPYPAFTDADRMTYSEPVAMDRVAVSPDQALAAAKLKAYPAAFKLTMLRGEPVYRIQNGKKRIAISAVDGRKLGPATADQAGEAVRRLLPGRQIGPVTTLFHDQWTVAQGFDPHRPLYRVAVKNAGGLTLYVSSKTGEVVQDTTGPERAWNWLGSIPHWIYLTVIRQDNEVWRHVIMWTSGPAIIGAAAGIWLGILRMRLRAGEAVSPYRGWMKWHHWSGLIAGVMALTWLVSGWLSVNPFQWFPRRSTPEAAQAAYAGHGAASFPADVAALSRLPLGGAREVRFTWVGGRPLMVLMGPGLRERVIDAASGAPAALSDEALLAAARALVPDAPVSFVKRLTREDAYWYSTHRDRRPLPVLRVGFADPHATWVHISPVTGEVLSRVDDTRRLYRWVFNAVHAWDLPIFGGSEIVRQIVIWGLSIGGLILSLSGVVIGWRRLKLKVGIRPKTSRMAEARRNAGQPVPERTT